VEELQIDRFTCEACAKTYRWKPELAGKRVKCSCGHVMTAPQGPPDDLYDLAPSVEQPKPARPVMAAVSSQPISPVMAYAGTTRNSKSQAIEESIGGSVLKEIYIPAAMVIIGLFLQIGVVSNWHFGNLPMLLPLLGARLGINLVLSFIGVMLVAQLMEVALGAPGPLVLKLVAIALAVPGIATVIGNLIGHDSAFVAMGIATMLETPIGVAMFCWLFNMEIRDAFYCVLVIWIINQWVLTFALAIIFHI
jgi:hypothetical protein